MRHAAYVHAAIHSAQVIILKLEQHLASDIKQHILISIRINSPVFFLFEISALPLERMLKCAVTLHALPNLHMFSILILQDNILAVVWRNLIENEG